MSILEHFNNDARRLIAFAWCQSALNVFPAGFMARMSKSEASPLDVAGDLYSDPIEAIKGINNLEKRAQAAIIRDKIKLELGAYLYSILEAKLIMADDQERSSDKLNAIMFVAKHIEANNKRISLNYISMVTAMWAKKPVRITQLVEVSGKSERQERDDRRKINDVLNEAFGDAISEVEYKLK